MPAPSQPTTRLGEAIRDRRKKAGFGRQQDLADALGVHQATISSWESGASRPDAESMLRLNDLLGVPLEVYFADFDRGDSAVTCQYLPDHADLAELAGPLAASAA